MKPDVRKDVRLLFVLGCPSRTTAEDVLLTDAYSPQPYPLRRSKASTSFSFNIQFLNLYRKLGKCVTKGDWRKPMPATARRVKKVQFIVASLMSPDVRTRKFCKTKAFGGSFAKQRPRTKRVGETRTTVRASTKDVGALFVLGCPSRTTAEDVLLIDEFLGIGEIAKQSS